MTAERWRQVRELYHAAAAHPPEARASILAGADEDVRREVETLLAREGDADGFLETPAMELAGRALAKEQATVVGQLFGPYELRSLLGAGGMGQVYRAWDPKLGREVAIKRLPPELAADPKLRVRLQREAQALAALNHPGIGAIYGLEEANGALGLVLELVEGPTLADLIGTLRLRDVLRIAREIVDALDAAHERGIVHRDLKPSNIKLAPGHGVKVLDFGLAKILTGVSEDGSQTMLSPAQTHPGSTLGTPAYMSPEQARGLVVDKRCDIWAFGCVLFEMLSGRSAFDADTTPDALVKVLEHEPDWTRIPRDTPDAVTQLIKRCLEKDPRSRLRDIGDARVDLENAGRSRDDRSQGATTALRRHWLVWPAMVVVLGAFAVWVVGPMVSRAPASRAAIEFPLTLPANVVASGMAVSPDGQSIALDAYGAPRQQIWLRRLDSAQAIPIPGSGAGWHPFWSPDGARVGFFTVGKLKIVNVSPLGPPVDLCDVPTALGGVGLGGSWSSDGTILFSADDHLFTVSGTGGTPQPLNLTGPDDEGWAQAYPHFLSDQRHFIYYATSSRGGAIRVGSLDSPTTTHLVDTAYPATYSAPYLLFVRGTTLVAQQIDPRTQTLRGDAASVVSDVAPRYLAAIPLFAASSNVLAVKGNSLTDRAQLVWFNRDGRREEAVGQPPGVEFINPAISPLSGRVAANRIDPQTGNWDIWMIDRARGTQSRLTVDPARDTDVIWSRTSETILFGSYRNGRAGLYQKSVDSSKPEELVADFDNFRGVVPSDWSPDGRSILFNPYGGDGLPWKVWLLTLGERPVAKPLLSDNFVHYGARFSPDGKWIAYASGESGKFEVYVRPFSSAGPRVQISTNGGSHPRWISGGREIAYTVYPGGIEVARVDFSGATPRVEAPTTVVHAPVHAAIDFRPHYDVTADGQHFLLRQPPSAPEESLTVLMNWTSRLRF